MRYLERHPRRPFVEIVKYISWKISIAAKKREVAFKFSFEIQEFSSYRDVVQQGSESNERVQKRIKVNYRFARSWKAIALWSSRFFQKRDESKRWLSTENVRRKRRILQKER